MGGHESLRRLFESILPGTTVAFIYETYSTSWELPLFMVREKIENGNAAVITSYTKPAGHLFRDLRLMGLDVHKAMEDDLLFIIDIFGSRYRLRETAKNLFYLENVEPETLNPKIWRIYTEHILPRIEDRDLIRLIYPLHGVVQFAGEEPTTKLMSQVVARYASINNRSSMVVTLNKDTVSRSFTAWTVELSDYVFLSKIFLGKGNIEEHLYFLKAPLPNFKPEEFILKKTGKPGRERFKIQRVREEEGKRNGERLTL
ncbi:hypothetical protein A3L09_07085 [Thermococcus profundus]|uniref:KaiC-like domain-containing protein n=1 Tax=Thermococcus profundus TaxID=49899 RepID=A0A2Z2M9M3_THEPR|nr:hypothetical protein [Thermococcus profundus]ASJ03037.1 hypothetical protein A3L09_07085 [Thermococcus profundus]